MYVYHLLLVCVEWGGEWLYLLRTCTCTYKYMSHCAVIAAAASWRTSDVTADIDQVDKASQVSEIIAHLKPFTQYAVYVQTYTIASANRGAMSDIVYFTTMSDGE